MRRLRTTLLLAPLAAWSLAGSVVGAQELSLFGGGAHASGSDELSAAWALDWKHDLSPHVAFTATLLNEGHITDHHRDGVAIQGWLQTRLAGGRLVLGAGVGPYTYFDTTRPAAQQQAIDDHGWGFMVSLGASWDLGNAWLLQLRANHTDVRHSFDTTSVLIGVGYRFDASAAATDSAFALGGRRPNEITVSPGLTIANNFESQKGFARSVEYRRSVTQNVALTAAWLDEGKSDAVRRNGIAAQLWLSYPLNTADWTIAIGLGPYYSFTAHTDAPGDDSEVHHLSAIGSLSTVYWFRHDSGVRFTWSRVATDDARDTDVFLLGLAYRF